MKLESCGAKCSDCPLRDAELVWSEKNTGAQIAIVTDHPGQFEVQYQRPLVGPASKVFTEALSQTNMYRGQFHITMSVSCSNT